MSTELIPTKTVGTKKYFQSKKFGKFSVEWKGGLNYIFQAEKSLLKLLKGIWMKNPEPENIRVFE